MLKKDELIERVWPNTFVEEANLAQNVSALRKALDDKNGGAQYIETVPKGGYRFAAAVGDHSPKSGNGSVPAYQKIQVAIRKRIESGDLRPGDVVSSERELARIYQVSLMTARHALDSLQREGVVERRRGVGTYISAPKIQFNKLMGYMELMASRGLSARSKVVYSGVRNDEYGIATRLSLPSTCPLIKDRARPTGSG